MHIRCPHCRNPIEVVEDSSFRDVECPSCGSHFNLVDKDPPSDDILEHFDVEHIGCTLILAAKKNELPSLSAKDVDMFVKRIEDSSVMNVVVDLVGVKFGTSSFVGFVVPLAKLMRSRGGLMALCAASTSVQEIFMAQPTWKLPWQYFETRQAALDAKLPILRIVGHEYNSPTPRGSRSVVSAVS